MSQTTNAIELTLLQGDLSKLNPNEKLSYFKSVCESVGLNPLTKPFEYIKLNGKEVLYATKGCAEQLRAVHKVSLRVTDTKKIEDVYVVTVEATDASGRTDSATGAVSVNGLKGDALANSFMKAETKAKRRVTLSICGLNMLDETEVETIIKNPAGSGGVPLISLKESLPQQGTIPQQSLVDKVMAARPSVQQSPIIESLLNDPEPPEPPHFDAHEKVDEYENENNVYKVPEEKKEVFEPGDFILPFKKGKNAGKKLKDISENDLKSTLIFCDEKGLANVATRIREYFNSKDEMPF